MKNYINKLRDLHACVEALEWCKDYPSLQKAWAACKRGDWMLWLAGKMAGKPGSIKRRKLVLACCDCAQLALKYAPKDEKRPKEAIEIARKWANGDSSVTFEQVRNAAYAAAYAAYAACAACAADATCAAADATCAAADAACAAANAADAACAADAAHSAGAADAAANAAWAAAKAADVVAYAAYYASGAAAEAAYYASGAAAEAANDASRTETLKKCADIVRKHYPKSPKI